MTGRPGQSKPQKHGGALRDNCVVTVCAGWCAATMEATEEQKKQARRVQRLLYGLMFVMIVAPVIVFLLRMR